MSKLSNYVSHTNGNANTLGGHSADYFASQGTTYTKSEIDTKFSGIIDMAPESLDTLNELAAAINDDPNFFTTISNSLDEKLDASAYTASDVLTKIKTVDGSSSGLDADLLDGHHASYFATLTHNHDFDYLGINAKAADSELLDGHDSSYFATSTHNHDTDYLGINAKAADSELLDGHDSSYFMESDGDIDGGSY